MSLSRYVAEHPEHFESVCAAKAREFLIRNVDSRRQFDAAIRKDILSPLYRGGMSKEQQKDMKRRSRAVWSVERKAWAEKKTAMASAPAGPSVSITKVPSGPGVPESAEATPSATGPRLPQSKYARLRPQEETARDGVPHRGIGA